ncbi:hypothetical protein O5D80_005516 [Batrachochytrium dendrobatidis]|nr:hypothetical protein O5D80_005516 [Batrachochytrium dendrobatidis]
MAETRTKRRPVQYSADTPPSAPLPTALDKKDAFQCSPSHAERNPIGLKEKDPVIDAAKQSNHVLPHQANTLGWTQQSYTQANKELDEATLMAGLAKNLYSPGHLQNISKPNSTSNSQQFYSGVECGDLNALGSTLDSSKGKLQPSIARRSVVREVSVASIGANAVSNAGGCHDTAYTKNLSFQKLSSSIPDLDSTKVQQRKSMPITLATSAAYSGSILSIENSNPGIPRSHSRIMTQSTSDPPTGVLKRSSTLRDIQRSARGKLLQKPVDSSEPTTNSSFAATQPGTQPREESNRYSHSAKYSPKSSHGLPHPSSPSPASVSYVADLNDKVLKLQTKIDLLCNDKLALESQIESLGHVPVTAISGSSIELKENEESSSSTTKKDSRIFENKETWAEIRNLSAAILSQFGEPSVQTSNASTFSAKKQPISTHPNSSLSESSQDMPSINALLLDSTSLLSKTQSINACTHSSSLALDQTVDSSLKSKKQSAASLQTTKQTPSTALPNPMILPCISKVNEQVNASEKNSLKLESSETKSASLVQPVMSSSKPNAQSSRQTSIKSLQNIDPVTNSETKKSSIVKPLLQKSSPPPPHMQSKSPPMSATNLKHDAMVPVKHSVASRSSADISNSVKDPNLSQSLLTLSFSTPEASIALNSLSSKTDAMSSKPDLNRSNGNSELGSVLPSDFQNDLMDIFDSFGF